METTDRLGRYRLLRLLATGGMGEVYLARQEGPAGFAKPVVIKRILPSLAREQVFIDMFVNEARLAALLQHPNVVQIFELGEDAGSYFIAMELIHGHTLRAMFQKLRAVDRAFPPGQLARICSQALLGLHYAHTLADEAGAPLGIIHRDLSPDNVMVGFDGAVKVLDFGIAKASFALGQTKPGTVRGKYSYMSPEHLRGEGVDRRTDLWAIGVILYELLTRRRPFAASGDLAIIRAVLHEPHPPLAEVSPQTPEALCGIVDRALSKDREARYSSAEEMAADLEAFATSIHEPLSSSETSAFMKGLYGAEANEKPVLTPSSVPVGIELPMEQTATGVALPEQGSEERRARRQQQLFAGLGGILLLVGLVAVRCLVVEGHAPVKAPAPPPATAAAAPDVTGTPPPPEPAPVAAPPPEPAPPPEEPAVAAAARGKVDLKVKPWAEVFEGKKSLGITPMAPLELSAGSHTLVLKNSDLDVSRTVVVKVPKNGTATVRVDLRH
jgi:serine/threonine-protein kinase